MGGAHGGPGGGRRDLEWCDFGGTHPQQSGGGALRGHGFDYEFNPFREMKGRQPFMHTHYLDTLVSLPGG